MTAPGERRRRGSAGLLLAVAAAGAVAALGALAACDSATTAGDDDGDGSAPDASDVPLADAGARAEFRRCIGRAFTPLPDQGWRHDIATPLVTATGAAAHSAQDVIAAPGATPALVGKFAYGTLSKDLEDEDVEVFLDTCGQDWDDLGKLPTNSDGRVSLAAPAALGPGVYEARFQVLGDQSLTTSFLWILPVGTRLVVTDIDGTMTASDSELFQQILDGSHVPVAYPGAVDLPAAHAELGHVVVYLTGRPYWLTDKTRAWLAELGFTVGPLHVTDSNGEALPTEGGVGAFKKAWIQGLLGAGYTIDFAYGNATTDIFAYLGAGLPADAVWIIGGNGGQMGTHAVADAWTARVLEVQALPPATQPFDWP